MLISLDTYQVSLILISLEATKPNCSDRDRMEITSLQVRLGTEIAGAVQEEYQRDEDYDEEDPPVKKKGKARLPPTKVKKASKFIDPEEDLEEN